jgi:hypothetical protein
MQANCPNAMRQATGQLKAQDHIRRWHHDILLIAEVAEGEISMSFGKLDMAEDFPKPGQQI